MRRQRIQIASLLLALCLTPGHSASASVATDDVHSRPVGTRTGQAAPNAPAPSDAAAGRNRPPAPKLSTPPLEHDVAIQVDADPGRLELMLQRQEDLARKVDGLRSSPLKDLAPAALGVLGALLGAGLANLSTSRLQRRRLENEDRASRAMAGIAAASKLSDFRSRQLYELYAPLEALLLQNVTVRGELYRMLIESRCADRTYEMRPDSKGHKGQSLFVVFKDGSPAVPFRLIEQMAYLQAHHDNVMGPVREIVSVNDRIVTLLHQKIGLVRSDNRKLSKRLGKFLAHQGVLQAVAVPGGRVSAALPSYTTTFPRRLDKLVKVDADKLRTEIKTWETKTAGWMAPLVSDQVEIAHDS